MTPDIEAVARILEETAAEEILPRFRALAEGDKRTKAGGEVVTVADEAAERRLEQRLTDLLPGSLVVGEEAAAADPAVFAHLLQDEPVWLIDPIDGTHNFSEGIPVFAVMVALVQRGAIRAAWIHDPPNARTAQAEEGAGAWMSGQRLKAAVPAPLTDMAGTLHAGQHGGADLRKRVRVLHRELGTLRNLRCAGAEYIRLAAGEMHYTFFTRLMPWDHAPGVLLHQEAGGFVQTAEGKTYSPAVREGRGLLAAPDQGGWQTLYEALFEASGPAASGEA